MKVDQPKIIDRDDNYETVIVKVPGFYEYITIDSENMDNEHTWLHEAVECALYKLRLGKVITIGEEVGIVTTIAHVMTSLSIGYAIQPNEIGEYAELTADEFDRFMKKILRR